MGDFAGTASIIRSLYPVHFVATVQAVTQFFSAHSLMSSPLAVRTTREYCSLESLGGMAESRKGCWRLVQMKPNVSHDRRLETPEAKARWFQSLTMEERMRVFADYMNLILAVNPSITKRKHVEPAKEGIQIFRKP